MATTSSMSSRRVFITSRPFHAFNIDKIRRPFPRVQPVVCYHVTRQLRTPLRSRTMKWTHSTAQKGSASPYLLLSFTGLVLWTTTSNTPSSGFLQSEFHLVSKEPLPPKEPLPQKKAFKYPQLSGGQKTRLMILQPGNTNEDLRCQLKPVSSLQDHEYNALSYFWGEKSGTHFIECSGDEIEITPNLDAALRQLRYTDNPTILWVDAVCINQKDDIEKARQVGIMQESTQTQIK